MLRRKKGPEFIPLGPEPTRAERRDARRRERDPSTGHEVDGLPYALMARGEALTQKRHSSFARMTNAQRLS